MRKIYSRLLMLALFLFCFQSYNQAQTVTIGNGSFGGQMIYGPMSATTNSPQYNRHAFIYNRASLGALTQGDTIRSLAFFREGTDSLNGSPMFRVYMATTTHYDFGPININWKKMKDSMTLVWEGDPSTPMGSTPGEVRFDFNKTPYFEYDTTGGKVHLQIFTEYIQSTPQNNIITFLYDSDASFTAYQTQNETKYAIGTTNQLPDTTNFTNVRKPQIKLFIPRYQKNLRPTNIYCLGKLPRLQPVPDNIRVRVVNEGIGTVADHPVYLRIDAPDTTYHDTAYVDLLSPNEATVVGFNRYLPDTLGNEFITATVGLDQFNQDNIINLTREVTYNVYSHTDPFQGSSGGIGFNGSSGDFVARFKGDTSRFLNQMKVSFAFGGQPFQFGLWEQGSNGQPGQTLFLSDTLTATAGEVVLPIQPPIRLDSVFYAGIRQTGNVNIGFAFQYEVPIRSDDFYFTSPAGTSDWVPFSPGFDFKFGIQPRIQVADDIGIVQINKPKADSSYLLDTSRRITPEVVIYNYGTKDQTTPFDLIATCKTDFGIVVLRDTVPVTINSGDTATITFNDSINPFYFNTSYTFEVEAKLAKDQVTDNNIQTIQFRVDIDSNLSLRQLYSPSNGFPYEQNLDTIYPSIGIANQGRDTRRNVTVRMLIYDNNTQELLYEDTAQKRQMVQDETAIFSFDTYAPKYAGAFRVLAYIEHDRDYTLRDDTLENLFVVIKSSDIAAIQPLNPEKNDNFFARSSNITPSCLYRNDGLQEEKSVWFICKLFDTSGTVVYYDSVQTSLHSKSNKSISFETWTAPDTFNRFNMLFTHRLQDQEIGNDSLWIDLQITPAVDITLEKLFSPQPIQKLESTLPVQASVFNKGAEHKSKPYGLHYELSQANTVLFSGTKSFTPPLFSATSDTLIFDESLIDLDTGSYNFLLYITNNVDEFPENDTLNTIIRIKRQNNLEIKEIISPVNDSSYRYRTTITPEIKIRNTGIDSINKNVLVRSVFIQDTDTIFSTTRTLYSPLAPDTVFRRTGSELYDPNAKGEVKMLVYFEDHSDGYAADDTAVVHFNIDQWYDASPVEILNPTDPYYYKGEATAPYAVIKNLGDSLPKSPIIVRCEIFRKDTLVFSDNKLCELNLDYVDTVWFNKDFDPQFVGDAKVRITTLMTEDEESKNNVKELKFEVIDKASVSSLLARSVRFYPNPTKDFITLQLSDKIDGKCAINIYGINGQKLMELKANTVRNGHQLDVSQLTTGTYVIEFIYKGTRYTQQFVKQ